MAKLISIPVAKETGISGTTTLVASGTATSYTANKLTDSGATFITDLVAVGDTVKDVTNGDTALVTDGTDADKVFNPGDVILKHDSDTVVGTVKSVSANLITLESGSGVAITDDDELVHASPIKIRLGLQY